MNILLKEINKDNWYDCVSLKVEEHQKNFVASNAFSLAQASYETDCTPLAIYNENTMIGFVMFSIDKKDDDSSEELWICRFMIDAKFQGKGYGRAAMAKILEHIKNHYDYNKVFLSEVPGNDRAKGLYISFGFALTGEVVEGEEVMVLKLQD